MHPYSPPARNLSSPPEPMPNPAQTTPFPPTAPARSWPPPSAKPQRRPCRGTPPYLGRSCPGRCPKALQGRPTGPPCPSAGAGSPYSAYRQVGALCVVSITPPVPTPNHVPWSCVGCGTGAGSNQQPQQLLPDRPTMSTCWYWPPHYTQRPLTLPVLNAAVRGPPNPPPHATGVTLRLENLSLRDLTPYGVDSRESVLSALHSALIPEAFQLDRGGRLSYDNVTLVLPSCRDLSYLRDRLWEWTVLGMDLPPGGITLQVRGQGGRGPKGPKGSRGQGGEGARGLGHAAGRHHPAAAEVGDEGSNKPGHGTVCFALGHRAHMTQTS